MEEITVAPRKKQLLPVVLFEFVYKKAMTIVQEEEGDEEPMNEEERLMQNEFDKQMGAPNTAENIGRGDGYWNEWKKQKLYDF